MSNINFSNGEISLLRLHYLQEYNDTRKKLQDIISILTKLGVSDTEAESVKNIRLPELTKPETILKGKRKYTRKKTAGKNGMETPSVSAEPKKRGRKPKRTSWAKFAIDSIRSSAKPLSARDILKLGESTFGITDANRDKAMQALQASLFRLTTKTKQLKGNKEKGTFKTYSLTK